MSSPASVWRAWRALAFEHGATTNTRDARLTSGNTSFSPKGTPLPPNEVVAWVSLAPLAGTGVGAPGCTLQSTLQICNASRHRLTRDAEVSVIVHSSTAARQQRHVEDDSLMTTRWSPRDARGRWAVISSGKPPPRSPGPGSRYEDGRITSNEYGVTLKTSLDDDDSYNSVIGVFCYTRCV